MPTNDQTSRGAAAISADRVGKVFVVLGQGRDARRMNHGIWACG